MPLLRSVCKLASWLTWATNCLLQSVSNALYKYYYYYCPISDLAAWYLREVCSATHEYLQNTRKDSQNSRRLEISITVVQGCRILYNEIHALSLVEGSGNVALFKPVALNSKLSTYLQLNELPRTRPGCLAAHNIISFCCCSKEELCYISAMSSIKQKKNCEPNSI